MAENWRIVPQGQRQTTALQPAGTGFNDVIEVTYEVTAGPAKGTHGTVRVPKDTYSPELVEAEINPEVEALNAVQAL